MRDPSGLAQTTARCTLTRSKICTLEGLRHEFFFRDYPDNLQLIVAAFELAPATSSWIVLCGQQSLVGNFHCAQTDTLAALVSEGGPGQTCLRSVSTQHDHFAFSSQPLSSADLPQPVRASVCLHLLHFLRCCRGSRSFMMATCPTMMRSSPTVFCPMTGQARWATGAGSVWPWSGHLRSQTAPASEWTEPRSYCLHLSTVQGKVWNAGMQSWPGPEPPRRIMRTLVAPQQRMTASSLRN